MKKRAKVNQNFVLKDQDYDDITRIYLTDYADACYDAMNWAEVFLQYRCNDYDLKELAEEYPDLYKKLGKIRFNRFVRMCCGDSEYEGDWIEAFEYLCKCWGIKLIDEDGVVYYEYQKGDLNYANLQRLWLQESRL